MISFKESDTVIAKPLKGASVVRQGPFAITGGMRPSVFFCRKKVSVIGDSLLRQMRQIQRCRHATRYSPRLQ